MQTQYEDGVYINLPEAEYHRIHAISASGIKNLLVSPVDFWARSWMNPSYNLEEDTDAQIIGTAYHKRVLEGAAKFYAEYAPEFTGKELPTKVDELREALRKRGQKTEGTSSELVARCARIGILTYATARIEYMANHDGKIFLSNDLIDNIEINAAMIEKNPILARCFQGGYPEVTIIWTENRNMSYPDGTIKVFKIRFKARIDYLKSRAIIDLKTWENRAMKAVVRAIYSTMASYKYHIQATFYMRAVEEAKKLIKRNLVFLDNEKVYYYKNEKHKEITDFCEKLIETEQHDFYFVFQQKGIAPFARGFKFPRTTMFSVGQVQIDAAIETYIQNLDKFGEEQWIDTSEIDVFEDDNFPPWATSDL